MKSVEWCLFCMKQRVADTRFKMKLVLIGLNSARVMVENEELRGDLRELVHNCKEAILHAKCLELDRAYLESLFMRL